MATQCHHLRTLKPINPWFSFVTEITRIIKIVNVSRLILMLKWLKVSTRQWISMQGKHFLVSKDEWSVSVFYLLKNQLIIMKGTNDPDLFLQRQILFWHLNSWVGGMYIFKDKTPHIRSRYLFGSYTGLYSALNAVQIIFSKPFTSLHFVHQSYSNLHFKPVFLQSWLEAASFT